MVDYVLSLLQAGHRGPITALSRRGLLPRPHRSIAPFQLDAADVPFGAGLSQFLHWLRGLVDTGLLPDQDWRSVVDALRPFTAAIWQNWPDVAKRRFLRHARAFWEVHRHRTAPEIDARLRAAIASGQVSVIAAKVAAVTPDSHGAKVTFRRRGKVDTETLRVAKIVSCVGVGVPPQDSVNPVLRYLLRDGLIRPDPIGIGLDVTADCAVIGGAGMASERIFAVGPLTRGRFWESTAIPDIRLQCAALDLGATDLRSRARARAARARARARARRWRARRSSRMLNSHAAGRQNICPAIFTGDNGHRYGYIPLARSPKGAFRRQA